MLMEDTVTKMANGSKCPHCQDQGVTFEWMDEGDWYGGRWVPQFCSCPVGTEEKVAYLKLLQSMVSPKTRQEEILKSVEQSCPF